MSFFMSSLFADTMKKLEAAISERGSIRAMAEKLDLNSSTISRWFAEGRIPDFRALSIIFEYLGVHIVFPGEKDTPQDKKISELTDEVRALKEALEKKKIQLIRAEGGLDELREQLIRLTPTPSPPQAANKEEAPERKNENVA